MAIESPTLVNPNAPYRLMSDFDGTITTRDSNDCATDDLGFGEARRRELNVEILNGRPFRDAFAEMLESVWKNGHRFEEVRQYLITKIGLDSGFKECFEWCKENDVPLDIVSSGMKPIIAGIFQNLVGVEDAAKIDVIANDVEISEDGAWKIVYRHPESPFGHDKSRSTAMYKELPHKPTIFFCGDGVSDLSAAKAADLLFVKVIPGHTNDLMVHCLREKIPFVPFEDFIKVKEVVASVVKGGRSIPDVLAEAASEQKQ